MVYVYLTCQMAQGKSFLSTKEYQYFFFVVYLVFSLFVVHEKHHSWMNSVSS